MSTPLDIFTNRPARTDTETFPVDPSDADRLRKLKDAARKAKTRYETKPSDPNRIDALEQTEKELAEHEASIRTITFHVQAVGDKRVEELMLAYPPTKEQKTKARKEANGDPSAEPQFDEDRFAPALLAEAVTHIVDSDNPDTPQTDVTLEQMTAMWNAQTALSTADRVSLFTKAMMINQAPSSIEVLGKG